MRAARNLMAATQRVLAVVPLGATALAAALEAEGCEVLATDRTDRGMGASLAAAVEATATADGWIVALGDMPAIAPATISWIAQALVDGATVAAPFDADGRRGHPVGFGAGLRAELQALDGDVGARHVIEAHAAAVTAIVVDDPGIFVDIDTAQDLGTLSGAPPAG